MYQAQSSESALSQRIIAKLRDNQGFFVAADDILHQSVTVYQNADLPTYVTRNFHKPCSQFTGANVGNRDAPAVESFQSLDLALFQAC